jgi:nitrous oxide reductase
MSQGQKEMAMNRRRLIKSIALAFGSAAMIAMTAGSMITAADARSYTAVPVRYSAKSKKPPICFEDGCKGDRCIFCTR